MITYYVITVAIAAGLAALDKKLHGIEQSFSGKKRVSKQKKILAAVVGTVATFAVLFLCVSLLGLNRSFALTDPNKSMIGPASIIMVGGSLGFSILFSMAGLLAATGSILCFEVLNFLKVERNRMKIALVSTLALPVLSLIIGNTHYLLNESSNNLLIQVLSNILQNGATITGATVTTLLLSRFEGD